MSLWAYQALKTCTQTRHWRTCVEWQRIWCRSRFGVLYLIFFCSGFLQLKFLITSHGAVKHKVFSKRCWWQRPCTAPPPVEPGVCGGGPGGVHGAGRTNCGGGVKNSSGGVCGMGTPSSHIPVNWGGVCGWMSPSGISTHSSSDIGTGVCGTASPSGMSTHSAVTVVAVGPKHDVTISGVNVLERAWSQWPVLLS